MNDYSNLIKIDVIGSAADFRFLVLNPSRLIYQLITWSRSVRNVLLRSLLFFLLGICFALHGQAYKEGYIVTNKNDTLKGFVKNRNLSISRVLEKLRFKKEKEGEEQEFSPDQLKSYLSGTDLFISRNTSLIDEVTKKAFMQVMVQGYLSYYELEHTGPGSRSTYLTVDNIERFAILQKQDEHIQFVVQTNHITLSFKKRIMNYLKDDPALCRKIKKGIYTRNDVLKIVNAYNSHRNQIQPGGL